MGSEGKVLENLTGDSKRAPADCLSAKRPDCLTRKFPSSIRDLADASFGLLQDNFRARSKSAPSCRHESVQCSDL